MFSFKLLNLKSKFVDVIEQVKNDVDESYADEIALIGSGEGCLVPILFKYTSFDVDGDEIVFLFEDRKIRFDLDVSNAFCATFRYSYTYGEFFDVLTMYLDGIGFTGLTYKDVMVESENDSGQSKIFLSTLLPMLDADRKVDILVIGSSSDKEDGTKNVEAGRTYEALSEMLDSAGYEGKMLCIDPCEEDHKVEVGNIQVEYRNGFFSWKDPIPGDFTHVFDDVWIRPDQLVVTPVPYYERVDYNIIAGKSKFSYRVVKDVLELRMGLKEHKDLEGAIGGGHVKVNGNKIRFFGTSLNVGHYDKGVMQHVFHKYKLEFRDNYNYGRRIWDPDGMAFKTYKNAVVCTKYFGEDYKGGCVLPQTFYEKKEERYLYGKRLVLNKKDGCGCEHCRWYSLIRERFKIYVDTFDVDYYLSRVISDGCIKRKGDEFRKITNLIHSAARTKSDMGYIIKELSAKGYPVKKIVRGIMFLMRMKKITVPLTESYDPRYNIEIGGRLYRDGSNADYYDIDGEFVVKRTTVFSSSIVPLYRNGHDSRREAALYFASQFKEVFCFVDGYSDIVCGGSCPCGFSDMFEYSIEKEGNGLLILRFKEFGLFKNY